MTKLYIILFFLSFSSITTAQINLVFKVNDSLQKPVQDAYVFINGKARLSNEKGIAKFDINEGSYSVSISHILYQDFSKKVQIIRDTTILIALIENREILQEVIVTAKEKNDITSTSVIDKTAMSHIQPSSLTDVMSLLPGRNIGLPVLNVRNNLNLRQKSISDSKGDYATSSLGVSFLMDGLPINSNANMQQTVGGSFRITPNSYGTVDGKRNIIRRGVDMRAIATDGIEKIEIVRGVASAKYGDLSSGLVRILRKKGATRWKSRFKSDGFSKLASLGKGYYFDKPNLNLNFELGYLDAIADPRNSLENYKRYTASFRAEKIFEYNNPITWSLNIDYTGTLDEERRDPDIGFDNDDYYKSKYNSIRISNTLNIDFANKLFDNLNFKLGINQSYDKIEQRRRVQVETAKPAPISTKEGDSYGIYLAPTYISNLVVDGKPLDIFSDISTTLNFSFLKVNNKITAGTSYSYSKNNGLGQVYDPINPPSDNVSVRPRAFKDIPAMQSLALYAEDVVRFGFNKTKFTLQAGIRTNALLGLNSQYEMSGKFYFDPRINVKVDFPRIQFNNDKELTINLSGGYGKQTKLPTQNMLYPQDLYRDFEQLNYYHKVKKYRQLHYKTYVFSQVNYALKPAVNDKKEIRLGLKYDYHTLYATFFKEKMSSGFRKMSNYHKVFYKKFDTSGIDYNTITEAPLVENLPFKIVNAIELSAQESNGSTINKNGIEFQYLGKRFKSINTRFTLNGAWFKSEYSNSLPYYKRPFPYVINGREYFNTGEYQTKEFYIRESFQTSLTADTYLKSLGLTTSIRFDLNWFDRTKALMASNIPTHYINENGVRLPYTQEDQNDAILRLLVRNERSLEKPSKPFSLSTHIKVSKDFYKYFTMSMYVNNLLNYYAKNENSSNATAVRNFISPYFGMEMNINF